MNDTAAKLLAVSGPIRVSERGHKLVFTFIGLSIERQVRKLSLNFSATARTFGASNGVAPQKPGWRSPLEIEAWLAMNPNARQGPFTGSLTDLLRSMLRPPHIAAATALSMRHGGTP